MGAEVTEFLLLQVQGSSLGISKFGFRVLGLGVYGFDVGGE